jgi:hypothetical protein
MVQYSNSDDIFTKHMGIAIEKELFHASLLLPTEHIWTLV